MSWEILKADIDANVYTNTEGLIDGDALALQLKSMASAIGENATYAGVATPTTDPGSPDGLVFYFAIQAGTYSNFGAYVHSGIGGVVLSNATGSWVGTNFGFATTDAIEKLDAAKASATVGKNLFNAYSDYITSSKYLTNTGEEAINSNYIISAYMPVTPGLSYTKSGLYGGNVYSAFYDEDLNILTYSNAQTVTAPTLGVYLRITVSYEDAQAYQLEQGSSATEFEEYTDKFIGSISIEDGSVTSPKLADSAVTNDKISDQAITKEKTLFIYDQSENLYNPSDPDVVTGYYLESTGLPTAANSSYKTTGFIRVAEGDVIVSSNSGSQAGMRFLYYYDANKELVGGYTTEQYTFTVPSGVYFMRVSFLYQTYTLYQIETGGVITTYKAYSERIALDKNLIPEDLPIQDGYISRDMIADGAINADKIESGTIDTSKVTFVKRTNLFNKNASDLIEGAFVTDLGVTYANASYDTSGYIPVTVGTEYAKSGAYGYGAYSAFYDADKAFLSSSNEQVVTAPALAAFIRVSLLAANIDTYMLVEGAYVPSTYYSYDDVKLDPDYIEESNSAKITKNLVGNDYISSETSSLTTGNSLEISEAPKYIKKGASYSMRAELTAISGSVSAGKGYATYRGRWLEIDATNVIIKYYETSENTLATIPHGLTISDFLYVSLDIDDLGQAKIILNSLSGLFVYTYADFGYDFNGSPFVLTTGQTLSNVNVSFGSKDYRKPVWIFGDSYISVTTDRWPYYIINDFGITNFFLNGVAGETSPTAFPELERCLNFGTPKYLIWALGMNDTDSDYTTNLAYVESLCDNKGITLILTTIPTVPEYDKEVIKAAVLASGYRYIDFYTAVGAASDGTWYTGYIEDETTGVHPTILGAKALAARLIMDFPEIKQYE